MTFLLNFYFFLPTNVVYSSIFFSKLYISLSVFSPITRQYKIWIWEDQYLGDIRSVEVKRSAFIPVSLHLTCLQGVMEQNLEDYDFGANDVTQMHKCSQCNYNTSQKRNLKMHLEKHRGEKSHKCNQCDFASFSADNLRRHLKAHRGQKSNKCNQCNYASTEAGNLRRHLDTHK